MNGYGIWLSYNNQEEGFQIPINPPSIQMKDGSKGTTYDVSGLGEINVIKDPQLTGYTFGSVFPAVRYPFVDAEILLEPRRYVDLITKWMGTNRPIRFVYTGSTFDINTPASIESFEWGEVGGTPGDIEYKITLKKYVFYAARLVVTATQTGAVSTRGAQRPDDREKPKTYTIAPGDSLWTVAQRQLGSGARYKEIQSLNNITDAQLKALKVGSVIKIP